MRCAYLGKRVAPRCRDKNNAKVWQMKWRNIPEWDRYEVSEFGDIRSKDMEVNAKGGKTALRKGRNLALVTKNNGYICVTLTNGTSRPQIGVHRLVARAFLGECPIGLYVLHWDGDKRNNHYSNLRYGTPAENVNDERRMGKEGRILDRNAVIEIHGVWYKHSWKHI